MIFINLSEGKALWIHVQYLTRVRNGGIKRSKKISLLQKKDITRAFTWLKIHFTRVEESPLPVEIQRKVRHELSWPRMEHEITKTEGTIELQVVADKVTKTSKFSSSSSTQPFEDKEKSKKDESHKQVETPQPKSSLQM
ncbi:unnamed protein product [Lupinus luteus]|uniref:Uncharacterized protein n=1 Tax=Lupinus luteus TaxID=3873 RepID=A0AAV1W1F7_LUPLU